MVNVKDPNISQACDYIRIRRLNVLDRQSRAKSAQENLVAIGLTVASGDSPFSHWQKLEVFINEVICKKYELKLSKLAGSVVHSWGLELQSNEPAGTIWKGEIRLMVEM